MKQKRQVNKHANASYNVASRQFRTIFKVYTEVLGMKLLRKRDYEEGRFTLAFLVMAMRK